MNSEKLLNKCPLSAKTIHEWFVKQFFASLDTESIPKEFKEYAIAKGVNMEDITKMIDVNPRCLLDVLDENNVMVIIIHYKDKGWLWKIDEEVEEYYGSRRDAEKDGITKAIEMLENKLKKEGKITK